MNNYASEKWNFLFKHNIDRKIFNYNDLVQWKYLNKISYTKDILISTNTQYNNKHTKKWINVKKIIYFHDNMKIMFNSYWGNGYITSQLIGNFNIKNILLAFASLLSLGYSINNLLLTSNMLTSVYGRMQKISKAGYPKIIIDYAHTPDALTNVLKTLKNIYKAKIWCIFGCGGNRDQSKRSKMGAIAEKLANKVIVTNDNPRNENSLLIIKDIIKDCKKKPKIIIEREEAINYAIKSAKQQDIILIAGKGHEKYQIIGNNNIKYSDHTTVFKILGIN